MSSSLILTVILLYFIVLVTISYVTGRKSDNDTFFLGNRKSPWYVVAFGMIGASLSGVTFISVPGWVQSSQFSYMQVVLGYMLGYMTIVGVLLPLYYRLQLTSIYTYLDRRFGSTSYKTGSFYFLISRVIGASFRLFLVAIVLQDAVLSEYNIPFWLTVVITIVLIWVYTFRSGIKTIIWTDTLQTAFMLAAVILTIVYIKESLLGDQSIIAYVSESASSRIFFFDDVKSGQYFWKQFLSGAFIAIVMTGLDQDMMQKNLSCRNLRDAQKNMLTLSVVLVVVNLIFLALGVLLYDYAQQNGIDATGDHLFSAVALKGGLGTAVGIFFIIGLIAAAYSSADSALTALTTSFCVDFLGLEGRSDKKSVATRKVVHLGFSLILLCVILIFRYTVEESVIKEVFVAAGYTYGPLLGFYAFGLFTRRSINDKYVLIPAIVSPVLCYFLKMYSMELFGFEIGFELLIYNGLLMFLGLLILSIGRGVIKEKGLSY